MFKKNENVFNFLLVIINHEKMLMVLKNISFSLKFLSRFDFVQRLSRATTVVTAMCTLALD